MYEFSIITPCSSRDIYRINELKENLKSQSFTNFEWVVACNDPKLSLIDIPFGYKHVRYKCNNVASARNSAMKVTNGKFLVFVDADDYLNKDALTHLYNVIKLCNDDNLIYDLHPYKTYEPEKSFISSIRISSHPNDYLPDWGGKKHYKINRYFDYLNLSSSIASQYNNWLNNRYWLYSDENKYDKLSAQLNVNGKVIGSNFINRYRLSFNTDDYFYSNIRFMLLSLENSKGMAQLSDFNYIKVRHNDPITDPSNRQIYVPNRWLLWVRACFRSVLDLNDQTLINSFVNYFISRINRYFYKAFVKNSPLMIIDKHKTLIEIQKLLQLVNLDYSNSVNNKNNHIRFISYQILSDIKHGKFTDAKRLMSDLISIRNVHKIITKHGRGTTKDFYYLSQRLPLNNKVIFYESFLGRSYSDNPKYIYRYIQHHYLGKFLNVWVADNDNFQRIKNELNSNPNTIVVKRWGFRYMLYLATSKYFVYNMRQPKWFIKRPGMRFIETWHGTPLKRLVFDMDDVAGASLLYKEIFYHQSRQWDQLLTDNLYSYNVFKHAFMYPHSKMLKSGYPRNDILCSPSRNKIAIKIKKKLGIPLNKKVILYAPTWRDNQVFYSGHYKFTLTLNIALLKKYLSKDYVMILRTHYFITNHLDTSSFGNFVYNESNYDDISELYLISDILITDYSSVFFDYAILQRPILYYVYDYDTYAKVLHGFYLDMNKDLPGPLIKTSIGILKAIQNIGLVKKRYSNRYKCFNKRFNAWDDGHASKRAVEALFKK